MASAYLIITDSGGIQEEGPSLRKPVLVFRKVTERPEGVHTGGVRLIGVKRESVTREASRLLQNETAYRKMAASHNPYGDGHAARRIVQAMLHYFGHEERPENFIPQKMTERRNGRCNFQAMPTPPEEISARKSLIF
jgi:UDP-N-acetylglucosamine 2-epimerase (non-hydrolysing)